MNPYTVHWWFFPNLDVASVSTQASLVHFYEALINVLYRNSPYPLDGAENLKLSHKNVHVCNNIFLYDLIVPLCWEILGVNSLVSGGQVGLEISALQLDVF